MKNNDNNRISLTAHGSDWILVSWGIQKDREEKMPGSLGADRSRTKLVLRVYDMTESDTNPTYFDLMLKGMVGHRFIPVIPSCRYFVEIGFLDLGGCFAALARSNLVTTSSR